MASYPTAFAPMEDLTSEEGDGQVGVPQPQGPAAPPEQQGQRAEPRDQGQRAEPRDLDLEPEPAPQAPQRPPGFGGAQGSSGPDPPAVAGPAGPGAAQGPARQPFLEQFNVFTPAKDDSHSNQPEDIGKRLVENQQLIAELVKRVAELSATVINLTEQAASSKTKPGTSFDEPAPKVNHKDVDKPARYSGDKWAT